MGDSPLLPLEPRGEPRYPAHEGRPSPGPDSGSVAYGRMPRGEWIHHLRRFAFMPNATVNQLCGLVLALAAGALAGCAGGLRVIEHPSPNHDDRVRFLVLHYTGGDFDRALQLLTDGSAPPRVSAHYLISAPGDPAGRPQVYRLVDESRRAWHAGVSQWQGRTGLNDTSIGIEIVYRPDCADKEAASANSECVYPDFPPAQIATLVQLAQAVLARHPQIEPTGVVGHSDIAPDRKLDPGPRFPWQTLHQAGIGAWYDDADVARFSARLQGQPLSLSLLQDALAAYGYDIAVSGVHDPATRDVLSAFRAHFLPEHTGPEADVRTTAIALALLRKYQPAALEVLAGRYAIDLGD